MAERVSVRTSLREVANRAGVSDATVSRILNGVNVSIAPETRRRVNQVARELGYQPNRAARALTTGYTQTIALWSVNLRSLYSAHMIDYTHQEMALHNYDLMISGIHYLQDGTLDTSRLMSWPIDGILAVDLPRGRVPGLENSLIWGKAFVNMGAYVMEGTDYIHLDFTQQAIEAVRHLHTIGCKRIAYLVPDWFEWFQECNDARLGAYKTVMEEIGQKPEFIITPNQTRQAVALSLNAHIEKYGAPDGLFCFNDDLAIGALRALRDLGMNIPEDIALVGCDGIEETTYMDPRITTIIQPIPEMCAMAWTMLEQRIRTPSLPVRQVTLQPRLEIRASSTR